MDIFIKIQYLFIKLPKKDNNEIINSNANLIIKREEAGSYIKPNNSWYIWRREDRDIFNFNYELDKKDVPIFELATTEVFGMKQIYNKTNNGPRLFETLASYSFLNSPNAGRIQMSSAKFDYDTDYVDLSIDAADGNKVAVPLVVAKIKRQWQKQRTNGMHL